MEFTPLARVFLTNKGFVILLFFIWNYSWWNHSQIPISNIRNSLLHICNVHSKLLKYMYINHCIYIIVSELPQITLRYLNIHCSQSRRGHSPWGGKGALRSPFAISLSLYTRTITIALTLVLVLLLLTITMQTIILIILIIIIITHCYYYYYYYYY